MSRFWRPTMLPIDPAGTPDKGFATMRVTSPYGNRSDQVLDRPIEFHGGLDIGNARLGDRVTAIGGGLVILASDRPEPPWNWPTTNPEWEPSFGGRVVVIRHDSGVWSQYAHLGAMAVREGDQVQTTQTVGQVGESGSAKGRGHLHFGIRLLAQRDNGHDGWVDPWPLIQPTGRWEDPDVIAELRETIRRKDLRIEALEARRDAQAAVIAELEAEVERLEVIAERVPELRERLRAMRRRLRQMREDLAEAEAAGAGLSPPGPAPDQP